MRKFIKLLLALIILTGIASCKKAKEDINKATEFQINYTSEVNVPASGTVSAVVPLEFFSPDIPTTSQSRFASEQTTQDLIEEIKLTKFTITSVTGNLDFLKSVTIFIRAANLTDVQVASKTNIPAGSAAVQMDLTQADIKQHIFKDQIQFKIQATVMSGQNADQKLKIDQTVTVKGKRI